MKTIRVCIRLLNKGALGAQALILESIVVRALRIKSAHSRLLQQHSRTSTVEERVPDRTSCPIAVRHDHIQLVLLIKSCQSVCSPSDVGC